MGALFRICMLCNTHRRKFYIEIQAKVLFRCVEYKWKEAKIQKQVRVSKAVSHWWSQRKVRTYFKMSFIYSLSPGYMYTVYLNHIHPNSPLSLQFLLNSPNMSPLYPHVFSFLCVHNQSRLISTAWWYEEIVSRSCVGNNGYSKFMSTTTVPYTEVSPSKHSSHPPAFWFFPPPLLGCSPSLREDDINVLFNTEHSIVTYS